MWKNRRVLVTGATGLLGSHMVEWLYENDAKVVALVRDFIPHSRYLAGPAVDEVTGNVEDFDLVSRVINEYQIQTVFHLAAQTQVSIANKNPMPTFRTNIMGTINVLEACRLANVDQVLVASSDKAYGSHIMLPYDESTPLRGDHPYDVSKSCVDLIAQTYENTYGMNVGITRCGNLFGPGDLNFNRLIPGTIQSILNGTPPKIRSNGYMIRDYFYVKDAVLAYILLAEHIHTHPRDYFIYNFSYGEQFTVLQMTKLILNLMGSDLTPVVLNEANNEIKEQYLDSDKAKDDLKWKPKWTIQDALKETIEWYKENL